MDIYITNLKASWHRLNNMPILTVEQIKDCDNDCVRMYLFCYYDYPEFYNYKKKKLLNRQINDYKQNILLMSAWCGHLNILKYLVSCGLDSNYETPCRHNAYMFAACNGKIEMMKYLETININIYVRDNDSGDSVCEMVPLHSEIYIYIMNKSKYTGYSKICSICYEDIDDMFITCKNNHIVHLDCQIQKDKNKCLMCSTKYIIRKN